VKAPTALGFVGLVGLIVAAVAFGVWSWLLRDGWFVAAAVLIAVVFAWAAWGSWVDYRHRQRLYEAWRQGDRPLFTLDAWHREDRWPS
jgi:hypothetical protein